MGKGTDSTFNVVSMVFIALTIATCLCSVLMMADIVSPPGSIAPVTDVPQPTLRLIPTLGDSTQAPTPTPRISPTPVPPTLTPLAPSGG